MGYIHIPLYFDIFEKFINIFVKFFIRSGVGVDATVNHMFYVEVTDEMKVSQGKLSST